MLPLHSQDQLIQLKDLCYGILGLAYTPPRGPPIFALLLIVEVLAVVGLVLQICVFSCSDMRVFLNHFLAFLCLFTILIDPTFFKFVLETFRKNGFSFIWCTDKVLYLVCFICIEKALAISLFSVQTSACFLV